MSEKKQRVYLAGIGMGNEKIMTGEAKDIFQNCDCIIGAKRMTDVLQSYGKPIFTAYKPEEIQQFLIEHKEYKNVAVALSGDTGFYSGAKKLKEYLPNYDVEFIPGISSVVYLAAKLGISWEDASLVSIHGRKQNFIYSLIKNEKTFLLFGGDGSGTEICEKIHYYGLGEMVFCIGRNLSYADEVVYKKSGETLTPEDFEGLAAAYVFNSNPDKRINPHLTDDEFIRGKVPMTKAEIRSISISKLSLTEDAVLYDIGAGTGSISIEAALLSENIKIYAIEKNSEGIEILKQNRRKFCCDHIKIIEGDAPYALTALETPTHVFIGGSGGRLKEIVETVRKKNPKVKIVLNAISLETIGEVTQAIKEGLFYNPEIVQISLARSRKLGNYHMMTGLNPVYIISDVNSRR